MRCMLSVCWRLWRVGSVFGRAGGDALCALCMLEAVEGALCLREVLEVPEAMHCVQLCSLEVMRCVLSVCWRVDSVSRGVGVVAGAGRAGGDALCATLYAGGIGGVGGDEPCALCTLAVL